MPDTPPDLPPRVAILEEIARRIDMRLDAIDRRLERMEDRMWSNSLLLVGIVLGGFIAIAGAFAGLFTLIAQRLH